MDEIIAVAREMFERRAGLRPQDKIGWYYRYWPSMKLTKGETPTFIFDDWNEAISKDPLFNKKAGKRNE